MSSSTTAAPLLGGRTAVVTGGAQGIGFEIARSFVEAGARVVLGDLDVDAAQAAADALGGSDVARAVRCDVVNAAEVDILLAEAVDGFGSLDVLVNNAGITRDATMRTMTEDDFDLVIAVHLKGTWNGTRKAAAIMREAKRGAIVNISSLSGKVGMVGQTNYSAAKAGIVGMTKAAAKEMAHHGVRVNAIQPGLIRSAMTEAMPQKAWDQKMSEIPMHRAGEVGEVASVALFLASDMSSYMTGTVLEVTGGRFM
ncbi:3-oxoacyl-ACP reductase FabG [Gordonia terrae]|uniref:3-oxoacyl-ACP reductase FabG n=1 Tax=Gordonia terrae TaxID=2055 RepID=UPI003F6B98E2